MPQRTSACVRSALPALLLGATPLAALPAQRTPAPPTPTAPRAGDGARTIERERIVERLPDGSVRVRTRESDDARPILGVRLDGGDERGVRVAEVTPDGPAARAGVREGDRIVSIGGTALGIPPEDADDPELRDVGVRRLQRAVARAAAGEEVTLVLLRDGARRTVRVRPVPMRELADADGTPGAASGRAAPRAAAPRERAERGAAPRVFRFEGPDVFRLEGPGARGFSYGDPEAAREYGARMRRWADSLRTDVRTWRERDLPAWRDSVRADAERRPALGLSLQPTGTARDTLGLFVASVTSGSPAERAGIVEGERIAAINGIDVRVPRDEADDRMAASARSSRFTRELRKAKPGDDVTLRVWGDGRYRTVTVKAGRARDVFGDEGANVLFLDGTSVPAMRLGPAAPIGPALRMLPPLPARPPVPAFAPAPIPPATPALRAAPAPSRPLGPARRLVVV